MLDPHSNNPHSTARIAGHPIHPMLVPLPIGFLVGALLTDIFYWKTGWANYAYFSTWLIGAGIVTALLAAAFGMADFFGDRRVRNLNVARLHFAGNLVVVVLSAINLWQRADDVAASVVPGGIILSAVVVLLLTMTGWLGGELAYRHRVGVMADAGSVRIDERK